jgi:hypothetical protein
MCDDVPVLLHISDLQLVARLLKVPSASPVPYYFLPRRSRATDALIIANVAALDPIFISNNRLPREGNAVESLGDQR